MDRRSYHHGSLRTTLMDLGEQALESGRWDELSLRELARTAGVSHTAPYRHFQDRNALRHALRDREIRKWCEILHGLQKDNSKSPQEVLVAFGMEMVTEAWDRPHRVSLVFESELGGASVEAAKKTLFRGVVQTVLEYGHQSGLRKHIDPVATSSALLSLFVGTIHLSKARWIPERSKSLLEARKNLQFGVEAILKARS